MRLDIYLFKNGLCDSRTEAKNFIEEGSVFINGKVITKPAFIIDENENPEIVVDKSSKKYVSRGGLKLEAALAAFNVDTQGVFAIDIGASSGGFTDCLLKNGAAHVISVDSGVAQLHPSLLNDDRVTSMENYNARYMSVWDFEYKPNFAVMDVSFISATYIMPVLYECLSENAEFICLIKPQFEVGKSNIGKGGIVKNEKAREKALSDVVDFGKSIGFEFFGSIRSPILGGDGNIEYLAHFKKRIGGK